MITLLDVGSIFGWCQVGSRQNGAWGITTENPQWLSTNRKSSSYGYSVYHDDHVCPCLNIFFFPPDLAQAWRNEQVSAEGDLFLPCLQDQCPQRDALHNRPLYELRLEDPASIGQAREPLDQQRSGRTMPARWLNTKIGKKLMSCALCHIMLFHLFIVSQL